MSNFTKTITHGIIFLLFIALVLHVTPGLLLGNRLNGTTYGEIIETIPLRNGQTQVNAEYTVDNITYTLIDNSKTQVDLLKSGTQIKIVYNPDRPDEAKLRANKFPKRIFIIPYFAAPFILAYSLISFVRSLLKYLNEGKESEIEDEPTETENE